MCIVLGALVLLQVGRLALRRNPLNQLTIPPLPTLSASATNSAGTNLTAKGTNATNATAQAVGKKDSTNNAASMIPPDTKTNQAAKGETNVVSTNGSNATNSLARDSKTTNSISAQATNASATNSPVVKAGTNETNGVVSKGGEKKATNISAGPKFPPGPFSPGGMGAFPGPGGMKKVDLPPAVQARVDKITQSEILAPVIRPQPLALLGIAGNSAFLRSPSGQSGLVKEGDELGGIKLLKIGTNRVLVEEAGEKKELMVFSGFGGESLLPKDKEQKETPK
ncbi:MAG: hypothetical protein ABIV39_06550 [Verrucomicrobiota bacterium]